MSQKSINSPKIVEETKTEPQVTVELHSIMYPNQSQSRHAYQSPTSAAPKAPYRPSQPSIPFGMGVLKTLRERKSNPYIDEDTWKALSISCQVLDIDSPAASGGKYFQLVPAEYMQTLAREHRFHEETDLGPYGTSSKFATAFHVDSSLGTCISAVYNNKPLSERLGWKGRLPDEYERPKLWYYPKNNGIWQVEQILEPMSGLLPHISCTLVESHPHMEDSLLFSEVWCIIMLTLLALRLPKNEKHNIVPITMVSLCDRQYRILQSFVDGKECVINIWKSRIVHFNKEGQLQKDFTDILRWVLAKPIGDTTKAH
ncbi:hypothetical protein F5Y01DRAFT_285625 [Xylaria sp. FL0043]|nr:hypothetical protein F5Y01DRAFT_285625 [Xylaria sp. FL0043]